MTRTAPARTRAAHDPARSRGRRGAPRLRLEVDERRAQLVELGLEHFGRRSYDDVSIDAIAQAAGISKGLLYHYFPTKRAFYAATVREGCARLLARTETSEAAPPLERLHAGLDAYLAYVSEHAPAYAALMRSGVGVDPEIARIVDETRTTFLDRLTAGMADAVPLASPLVRVALRGWVGFAEAASLAWAEERVRSSPAADHGADPRSDGAGAPPSREALRDLLARALLRVIESAVDAAGVACAGRPGP